MANLKGTGAPARTMQAAIGDIYTDEATGNRYKCVFAYRDDENKDYDCQWIGLKSDKKAEPVKEETKVEEPVKEETQEVKAQEPEKPAKSTDRKNYTNYVKPKNK